MAFSQQHKVFMVESYFRNGRKVDGIWEYSLQACMEEFRAEFPAIIIEYKKFRQTVTHCVNLFRESGSVARKAGSGRTKKRTEEVIQNVQHIIENAPNTSIRHLSQQVDLSVGTCHTILKKDLHLFPYRLTCVQELHENDYPQRSQFCQWFLNNLEVNADVLQRTFWTDEAYFHQSGYVNSQNMRMWNSENPHYFVETPQHPRKIGVWAGISQRRIIGPYFFEGNINAARYREEILTPFFNELHDDELIYGFFQQDGATAHTTGATLEYLTQFYENRVISRNTPNNWPPRSCDLTPCDFFLWPHLKNSIYKTPIQDLEELQNRIRMKIEEMNDDPALLTNVINGIKRRVRLCLEAGGAHFQHLL